MKTYLWCDSFQSSFEYDFIAVMAESLDEARNLAVKEVCRLYDESPRRQTAVNPDDKLATFNERWDLNERDERCIVVNSSMPIILDPNTALVIEHINQ